MSNVPIREKVKRITEAAKDGDSFTESSKNAGMLVLYGLFTVAVLVLLALTIGFIQSGHYIASAVTLIAGGCLGFVLLKIIRA